MSDWQNANEANNILPRFLMCPNCGRILDLEDQERQDKEFACTGCKLIINMNENQDKKNKFTTKLPEKLECPRCRKEVELEEDERKGKEFTCPWCEKHIYFT